MKIYRPLGLLRAFESHVQLDKPCRHHANNRAILHIIIADRVYQNNIFQVICSCNSRVMKTKMLCRLVAKVASPLEQSSYNAKEIIE